MRQILFVINPHAGQKTVEEFEHALQNELAQLPPSDQAIKVEMLIPDSPEQMRNQLRAKFEENPVDVVGVVGGDGTIMETLPILVEFPNIKLALIPYGTGNLLAANLGIPREFSASLDTLFNGKARRIDLGKINQHYFALIAGVGVVADIMDNTPRAHKKRFGIWAYLVNGIKTIFQAERSHFKIVTENREFTAHGVSVVISNAASFLGPCLPLTPEAAPDDGLLDVCIIRSRSRRDYFTTVLEVLLNQGASQIRTKHVMSFRTRRLHIAASKKLKVQADGNVIGTTPVDIEIIRNRLQIMVPLTEFDKSIVNRHQASLSLLETIKCYVQAAASEATSGLR